MLEKQTKRTAIAFLVVATLLSVLIFLVFPALFLHCFFDFPQNTAIVVGVVFWLVVVGIFYLTRKSKKNA